MILQILGASGTGKSTLGSALASEMGFPLLRSDHYLWPNEEFDVPRPVQERRRMLQEDIDRFPSFILDGGISWFFPQTLFPDWIVLLRCPAQTRMERLHRRETQRFGNWQDPRHPHHQITREFLKWAAGYETAGEEESNSLCAHMKLLADARCPALILWSDEDLDGLVRRILDAVQWEKNAADF
ncbi:MAG TPA: AAA family ATPase [Candidatus Pullichristensenella excrementigallinarum]|uniref:AAA family ATPase n=1 Tax=Candidatus Pullichristensenella excrementigallinarum TaxID=2840907 RepID=A0A9D1IC78_9FIRM|nr:AAA family ATPase [Candidatus Pullichristensenella excrementigallinarum]